MDMVVKTPKTDFKIDLIWSEISKKKSWRATFCLKNVRLVQDFFSGIGEITQKILKIIGFLSVF